MIQKYGCLLWAKVDLLYSGCSFFLMLEREKCRQSLQSCCLNEWKNSKNKPEIYIKPFLYSGEYIFIDLSLPWWRCEHNRTGLQFRNCILFHARNVLLYYIAHFMQMESQGSRFMSFYVKNSGVVLNWHTGCTSKAFDGVSTRHIGVTSFTAK